VVLGVDGEDAPGPTTKVSMSASSLMGIEFRYHQRGSFSTSFANSCELPQRLDPLVIFIASDNIVA